MTRDPGMTAVGQPGVRSGPLGGRRPAPRPPLADAPPPSAVVVARHHRPHEVAALAGALAAHNPGYRLHAGSWAGEADLGARPGSVAYTWLLDGRAEVWLPWGYRTQEGDGGPLPAAYGPDDLPPEGRERIRALAASLAAGAVHPQLAAPVGAICARRTGRGFQGDVAGDLWRLLESGLPPGEWVEDAPGREALAWLMDHHAGLGWSTKDASGWEPLLPGDQLLTTGAAPLRLRGRFRAWTIEDGGVSGDAEATRARSGAVRRLRYLRDTAGGCSPGFDAFRRLNLTWHPTAAQREGARAALTGRLAPAGRPPAAGHPEPPSAPGADAPNRLNSHVLHIEAAQSRTHYHPAAPVGGGRPQSECYFALDREAFGLHAPPDAPPRLHTFAHLQDWSRYETTDLAPGTAVFIPPGVGHRAVDAFVNIVTIPGFKPGNEVYVDRLIRRHGRGAPCNPAAG